VRASLSKRTVTASPHDIAELLQLIPGAVDLAWHRGPLQPPQCDESGETLPVPLLHFALPLDAPEEPRAFLQNHGGEIACYRLDLISLTLLELRQDRCSMPSHEAQRMC
jgi:hypothetical protein